MENDGFSSSVTYKNLFSQVSDGAAFWKMIWRVPAPQRSHEHLGYCRYRLHGARSYQDLDVQMKSLATMRSLSSWSPSVTSWIKLNSDGAVSNLEQRASIGGVLRDSNTNWLWGYAINFGNESVFKVETRAMLEGLFLAWDKGFLKVVVECDNTLLVELLLSNGGASSSLVELQLLHQVLLRKWEIHIRHIPRTFNGVADRMTKCADTCSSLIRLFYPHQLRS
ncbi:hypothetical protein PVK06_002155 [Gossypium arboreum]|uniref:RNase H type-1 domain-containing protein n=1 Tax=Gossypium arboreum TaxID=29729 RepID=A0ABR0R417_GOSAR|nr:hypothetical protein PVK06_002155 [Gossypium arboreum]